MPAHLLDANVILRYLTNDPPAMAERATLLFHEITAGQIVITIEDVILAEVVWTLRSFYRADRTAIADQLIELISDDNVASDDKQSLSLALTLYRKHNLGFTDALLAARSLTRGDTEIISFDRGLDRVPGIVRREPS
jgi:predicted nucleic-acid-binding protein